MRIWKRLLLIAVVAVSTIWLNRPLAAQEDRDERPNREWRRNGGPDRGRGDRDSREERPDERPAATESAVSKPTANSFGTVSESDKVRKYASDIVEKYDKDGDKILAGDELESLSSHLRNADSSGDGKITVDEIYQFSSRGSSSKSPANPTTSASAVPSSTSSKPADPAERIITNDKHDKRKSYRFKSTKELTNNWRFSSRDANGDGQVSMSEYTSRWNDRTAAEFVRYDKNNDGMITADEAK